MINLHTLLEAVQQLLAILGRLAHGGPRPEEVADTDLASSAALPQPGHTGSWFSSEKQVIC